VHGKGVCRRFLAGLASPFVFVGSFWLAQILFRYHRPVGGFLFPGEVRYIDEPFHFLELRIGGVILFGVGTLIAAGLLFYAMFGRPRLRRGEFAVAA
jgi:hypothetical protein